MYDSEVRLDEYEKEYRFQDNKEFWINVCKQELIDKSESKSLRILLEAKVFKKKLGDLTEAKGGFLSTQIITSQEF